MRSISLRRFRRSWQESDRRINYSKFFSLSLKAAFHAARMTFGRMIFSKIPKLALYVRVRNSRSRCEHQFWWLNKKLLAKIHADLCRNLRKYNVQHAYTLRISKLLVTYCLFSSLFLWKAEAKAVIDNILHQFQDMIHVVCT